MTLYIFDYGKFENLARIFDRNRHYRQRNFSLDNNNSSEVQLNSETHSKDDEAEDMVPPISTVCQGHVVKSVSNPDRRMSVPQLSRNKSVMKTREQRITSVIGVPHRHHITIAVNDEPVDIIKTTCMGPCLQACHTNSNIKSKSSLTASGLKLQNSSYLNSESRNPNQSKSIILMTVIYVLSTMCVRSILNLYIIINDITNVKRKITLAFLYFCAATITFCISLNCFSRPIRSITIRIELIVSILLILLWAGLHLIPITSWPLLIFTAALLSLGCSLLWDCQLRILSNWNTSSSCRNQIGSFNDIVSQTNILSTTSVIGHSLHMWSNILIFILLETLSSTFMNRNSDLPATVFPTESREKSNNSLVNYNLTGACGMSFKESQSNKDWKAPGRSMYFLLYVCIGLNVISLILVILLLDKSRFLRIPLQSTDKDIIHPMIAGNSNQNTSSSNPIITDESWAKRIKNFFFVWIRNNSKTFVKLWRYQTFRCVMPSLFTMGLVEGFFVTDYNQSFVSCYKKPSFIGISMIMFSLGPIVFVNIIPLIAKQQIIEIFLSPVSRAIFFSSSLLLALTKVGNHWSYLLVFFPWIVSLDTVICIAMFYISVSNLPNNLLDSSVTVQRVLRMLGVATYSLTSGVFGTFAASLLTIFAHIFVSPTIIVLGSLVRCSKT